MADQKTIEQRVKEIIGNVAMDISNYYSIERIGQDILIRVKFEQAKQ